MSNLHNQLKRIHVHVYRTTYGEVNDRRIELCCINIIDSSSQNQRPRCRAIQLIDHSRQDSTDDAPDDGRG